MKTRCYGAPKSTALKKFCFCIPLLFGAMIPALADTIPLPESDWQPFTAQVKRLTEALEYLGSPLETKTQTSLNEALAEKDVTKASAKVHRALDPHCRFIVNINPDMRVKIAPAPA